MPPAPPRAQSQPTRLDADKDTGGHRPVIQVSCGQSVGAYDLSVGAHLATWHVTRWPSVPCATKYNEHARTNFGKTRSHLGRQNQCLLRVVEPVQSRTVLGSSIVALSHALRRIVRFPEPPQKIRVGKLLRVEQDLHRLWYPHVDSVVCILDQLGYKSRPDQQAAHTKYQSTFGTAVDHSSVAAIKQRTTTKGKPTFVDLCSNAQRKYHLTSVWPVRPLHASSYVGLGVKPAAYLSGFWGQEFDSQ